MGFVNPVTSFVDPVNYWIKDYRNQSRLTWKRRYESPIMPPSIRVTKGRLHSPERRPSLFRDSSTVRFLVLAHLIVSSTTHGKGISYRGARGHYVAIKQDPSNILSILPTKRLQDHTTITVSWEKETPPSEENLARFCSVNKNKVLQALLWLCAHNPVYKSVRINYELLESWPQDHIPQEIRHAFLALQTDMASIVQDEREGYATSLQDGLFENELDAEVGNPEPGTIISRSLFSDFHGQDPQATTTLLASLQAVLESKDTDESNSIPQHGGDGLGSTLDPPIDPVNPHVSYKSVPGLPVLDSFTDPAYFTGAFPTLFPYACLGNYLQVENGYWATATADLASLTGDELHAAAAQFQSKTKISNPVIHTLIENVRIISSFNPESYGEKIRLRNLIFGKIGRLGIPLIWFTLNPHDIGNIFVLSTSIRSLPPSLTASLSVSKEAGTFGTISSYFGVVESTTRMMLHLHGFAWLSRNFGAANLSQRLLSDSHFKDRLITYIQSIIKETVDLTLGQRFVTREPPGSATFNMSENMAPVEFEDALSIDSNNVAAQVQMHVHSHTCTKYQRKGMKARLKSQQRNSEQGGVAGDIIQHPKSKTALPQICRFLFPKAIVSESLVTAEGFIRMQRNHQFVNKYNPIISSAIKCNHDVNFTPSSSKVLAAVYYMTNYVTKSQTDRGQLVLAAAVLKKAQEVAKAKATADVDLPTPPPLDMAKFALKAYHRFTRDTEMGAPAVAHFLLNQPSFYVPQRTRSVTVNFYWVKLALQAALASLLDECCPNAAAIEAEQFTEFDQEAQRPSLYENYRSRGQHLANLCFYEYASQIFVQTFAAAARRSMCYLFENTHPQYGTHVQVSVNSVESLATPALCESFTRHQDTDKGIVSNTCRTQDEIDETFLGLFYPWNKLPLDFGQDLQDLRASEYKNTYVWDLVVQSLPSYLFQLPPFLKSTIKVDSISQFCSYGEAALDVRGDISYGTSRPRVLINPLNTSTHFCDSTMVKAWAKELQQSSEAEDIAYISAFSSSTADQSSSLIPSLDILPLSTASLPTLQAMFHAAPTTDSAVSLIQSQYRLNSKQMLFLLYLRGVGGVEKTYLVKAFLFGVSIIERQEDVLLTASTGAAAANIGGSTYHSALSLYRNQPMRQAGDLLFQAILDRARSATLTEEDVATLNSQTVAARVARGEVPPNRAVIQVNQLREDVNLTQLESFATKKKQKINLFPARHDTPNTATINHALLVRMMFRVREAGKLKGPGFFAFTTGMSVMLLQNTKTSSGLVNGMTTEAKRAILDVNVQVTDYKCQGSTFDNLIVDLRFQSQRGLSEHQKWTSINVQLGRLRSLAGVWLREPITLADVQASPHSSDSGALILKGLLIEYSSPRRDSRSFKTSSVESSAASCIENSDFSGLKWFSAAFKLRKAPSSPTRIIPNFTCGFS
ncbi:uncharacterized protein PAC_19762 [Phialocephala subalpina]|uniref:ATP-dependent DNA helicase n=1 Tax=Phialocephala subalpina TaxID=576137 RepID=A0A1L7XXQ8_9HELO|nr:uncharacterized protein PAC_19762 [Phialocephala subalpina]